MANKTIQLLRNSTLFTTRALAISGLQTQLGTAADGQPILARYTGEDNKEHTLLGIKSAAGYEIFDNEGTSADIQATIAALDAEVTSTNGTNVNVTVTEVDGKITGVSVADSSINATDLSNAINALDSSVSATEASGNVYSVLTGVTQTDGVLASKTEVTLAAAAKTGAAADVSIADSGDNFTSANVEGALAELAAKAGDISVGSLDKTVKVQAATGAAFGTDLAVNIDGTTLVKNANTGVISTDLKIQSITQGEGSTYASQYQLVYGSSNTPIGDVISVAKDQFLKEARFDAVTQTLILTMYTATGATTDIEVDFSDVVIEAEAGAGLYADQTDHSINVGIDANSEQVTISDGQGGSTTAAVLTVGADSIKVANIGNAINYAISQLDATDTAVAGKYVSAVSEADGVVSVTRADVAAAVLNNYTKGSDATAVAATDTVNQAISKLENQVDNAKSAATTVVAEGTDTGNNMSIAETAGADGHKIFTISLTDVASDAALTAEIAARKAVDGQNGDTYAANAGANYISDATSLNNADVKLDAALKAADDAMLTGVAAGNGISVSAKAGKSQTITAVAVANDPIIEVTASGIATKEDAVFDAGTY